MFHSQLHFDTYIKIRHKNLNVKNCFSTRAGLIEKVQQMKKMKNFGF